MIGRTRAVTAVALSFALALPVVAASTASAAPRSSALPAAASRLSAAPADVAARPLQLPRPTGEYGVGSSVFHLVDRSRTDPWKADAGARELMLTLHYPAARPGPGRPAPYATTEETGLLVKGLGIEAAVPAAQLSATRTHSRPDARPARGSYPLIVLSPGFSVSRYTLTNLAEDLASRGYVVASLDHAYESYGISVPGGRTLTCLACDAVGDGGVSGSVVTATRAKDVSFVLDRLTGRHAIWRYADMIDTRRIGMAGHSIGGASAATAMLADRRVRAGINMDGAFWDALPAGGLGGRPFMMLGTDEHRPGGVDKTWDRTWPTLGGWKRWLTVAGSEHFTFSDSPAIEEHFGLPQPPLPAGRAIDITRTYVAAFFDEHLRGIPQPLLAGPAAGNPEVRFENP
ncbi:alpha/beta hydrolase [Streptomyces sp. BPTC-684]|uniref:alpha/beta hydrolase family protein n=1 Tax=Streptomyces sp. BPTC-684 TaxID=3043734 RepID=UPI0024B23856|nr:alpha/beta hydrolase [Streptomyces sp. BPTC-684]WHM40272.1 alpha/beta hydrolase [Streptomyces sp. BPTC-684]